MASSSQAAFALPCSSSACWKYDVFLSFRGPDTRKGITSEIHDALNRRGIKTFMDDQDLQIGDVISPTLLAAIRESRFAIVVLSRDYASSAWCLDELSEICRCMEGNSQTKGKEKKEEKRILPLFYHVDPSDVRHQTKSFGDAFTKHVTSRRHTEETLQQWRNALKQVANSSGWNTNDHRTHKELASAVVKFVCSKVLSAAVESMKDFEEFGATKQAMNEVMKALKDDLATVVGVYGMGGVGKTTLVKRVGSQACRNGIFDHMIMIVISQNPDLEQIQGTLADLLGFKLEEKTESGRASRIYTEIMRKHNILIILDDIWKIIDFSSIGIPSQDELKKCDSKVLLTTRITNVCHVMKCQRKIGLSILSKEDSWTLFLRNARVSFESTKFENVARRVAEECKGLPIALIAVARALGDKDREEWETAIRRLEKSQTANPDDEGHTFDCIKLSYDYLKSKDYKSCFLLCCLFPEDCDSKIEVLFRYAIGKGLFPDANTLHDARATVNSVVKHLKNSSLLLDSEIDGCVRMHDVIRDTAIRIAQDDHGFWVNTGFGLKNWPCRLDEGYSAISLMNNDICGLPEQFAFPKLELLLLNHYLSLRALMALDHIVNIPETFFQIPTNLRVLDLSQHLCPSLPQSLGLLTNLQVLQLDDCVNISNISLIGKLERLQILSMRYYRMKELLREIGDLTNLRILDLSGGCIHTIPVGVLSKLHKLEELYLQCGFRDWGSKVMGGRDEMNAGFDEVISLSNLRVLEVCISNADCIPANVESNPNWVRFGIWIGPYYDLDPYEYPDKISRSVHLDTPIDTFPDWFLNVVINKAETLECSSRQKLQELEERMNTSKVVSSENLKVFFCDNRGNVLLPSILLQRLPNLETLICGDVDGLEYVVGYEGFEPEKSKLRELYLRNLGVIRSICDGPAPPAMFRTLETVYLCNCNIPGSLFTSDVADCLFQLKELYLRKCSFLERIIEAAIDTKTILPKLKKLVLENLPMLSGAVEFECPSLEDLHVKNCPKFSLSDPDLHSERHVHCNFNKFLVDSNMNTCSLTGKSKTEAVLGKIQKPMPSLSGEPASLQKPMHPLVAIIMSCKNLLLQFQTFQIRHVYKEMNMVVDSLAKHSLNHEVGVGILMEPPNYAAGAFIDDLGNVTRARRTVVWPEMG